MRVTKRLFTTIGLIAAALLALVTIATASSTNYVTGSSPPVVACVTNTADTTPVVAFTDDATTARNDYSSKTSVFATPTGVVDINLRSFGARATYDNVAKSRAAMRHANASNLNIGK